MDKPESPAAVLKPLATLECDLAVSHWGTYEVQRKGDASTLQPWREDADPSPIGLAMMDAYRSPLRVTRPAVRAGWLKDRSTMGRGHEAFVEVSWDVAHELVAEELKRVTRTFGNEAIFGGSYGWSSAGRFHHAQSQVHRFLNAIGGYVRHMDSYSLGAARVLMPHIVAGMDETQFREAARTFGTWNTPLRYDPMPTLRALDTPQLWVLGAADLDAPSAETARRLRGLAAEGKQISSVTFPGAEHGITEFEEKNGERVDTHFSAGYFQLIVDWLLFKETKVGVQGPLVYRGREATPSAHVR